MQGYRPMNRKRGVKSEPNVSWIIGSMSPTGLFLGRLRPRRAGLRFIQCAQLINGLIQ